MADWGMVLFEEKNITRKRLDAIRIGADLAHLQGHDVKSIEVIATRIENKDVPIAVVFAGNHYPVTFYDPLKAYQFCIPQIHDAYAMVYYFKDWNI